MTFPEWTKPGAYGAVGGATIVSVLGFTGGGWVWPEVEIVITFLFVSVSLLFLYALPTSAQSMPENASAQRYGDGWECNDGYRRNGNSQKPKGLCVSKN